MKREQLTDDELRELLMQRKIRSREARVSAYRASGRVVNAEQAPINEDLIYNTETRTIERRSGSRIRTGMIGMAMLRSKTALKFSMRAPPCP